MLAVYCYCPYCFEPGCINLLYCRIENYYKFSAHLNQHPIIILGSAARSMDMA